MPLGEWRHLDLHRHVNTKLSPQSLEQPEVRGADKLLALFLPRERACRKLHQELKGHHPFCGVWPALLPVVEVSRCDRFPYNHLRFWIEFSTKVHKGVLQRLGPYL
jgi:hypothetical protein